jgi:cysteine dioxygenase
MIHNFIEEIKNKKNFFLHDILNNYNDDDWKKFVNIDEKKYNRIKIYENENLDIYIITWNIKQKANIHDHSDNGCWLKVLKGQLVEKIYDNNLKLVKTNILKENEISFMKNDIGYHSIFNEENDIAVSLHIYSPPNYKTKFII